jgi:hypothetical protein
VPAPKSCVLTGFPRKPALPSGARGSRLAGSMTCLIGPIRGRETPEAFPPVRGVDISEANSANQRSVAPAACACQPVHGASRFQSPRKIDERTLLAGCRGCCLASRYGAVFAGDRRRGLETAQLTGTVSTASPLPSPLAPVTGLEIVQQCLPWIRYRQSSPVVVNWHFRTVLG